MNDIYDSLLNIQQKTLVLVLRELLRFSLDNINLITELRQMDIFVQLLLERNNSLTLILSDNSPQSDLSWLNTCPFYKILGLLINSGITIESQSVHSPVVNNYYIFLSDSTEYSIQHSARPKLNEGNYNSIMASVCFFINLVNLQCTE